MSVSIAENVSLRGYNTLAVPVSAKYLVSIRSDQQVPEALAFARQHDLPFMVLGQGSNVVFRDDYHGVVLLLQTSGISVSESGEQVFLDVAAGENWHQLVCWCLQQGFFGIENLALIPGTVGAAPIQNIGAYGVELCSVLDSVSGWRCDKGEWQTLSSDECQLEYRDSVFKHALKDRFVITSVRLRLSRTPQPKLGYDSLARYLQEQGIADPDPHQVAAAVMQIRRSRLPDPESLPNAGSFFKNPQVSPGQHQALVSKYPELVSYPLADGSFKLAAGWLLERAGWKGRQSGGCGFHDRQALVMVNPGGASGAEIMALAEDVKDDIKHTFGVTLEIEPRVYQASG